MVRAPRESTHRVLRLPRGYRDHLDAVERQYPENHRQPDAAGPVRREAPCKPRQIMESHGRSAETEDVHRAEHDEQHDGDHLDESEPVLDRAKIVDRARIEVQEHEGEASDQSHTGVPGK